MEAQAAIRAGKTALGIELGSTRIKAVLIDDEHRPIASGAFDWENQLEDGVWVYRLDDALAGLRACYAALAADVEKRYGEKITKLGALGISAMMHGYLVFDKDGKQIAPFRTWRNTITGEAADRLTDLFRYNIPQRWSIAHLYQAILNNEAHVPQIATLTTLSGYIHRLLTGENVLGIGEVSGMFPVDGEGCRLDEARAAQFDALLAEKKIPWKLRDIMPRVSRAGENAGHLTAEGARLLDPTGNLAPGCPLCPPEGDAGTGMVATNSVKERRGNVSAGTSIFAMIVLEKPLSRVYRAIDLVTTPDGKPVAMVHGNTCTSDLDAWVKLFGEAASLSGDEIPKAVLYDALYNKALEGDADCGGLLSYNCFSGEPVTGVEKGRPLFVRSPDAKFTLANFMRAQLYSTLGALRIGMDILDAEKVKLDEMLAHGGLFKTRGVGQRIMAAALRTPVTVMESAGEGGAWGIALLAAFAARKDVGATLSRYLDDKVFCGAPGSRLEPDAKDVAGFAAFIERYKAGLVIENAAGTVFP